LVATLACRGRSAAESTPPPAPATPASSAPPAGPLPRSSIALSGPWQFREVTDGRAAPSPLEQRTRDWLPATVPGCVQTDLLERGLIPDPFVATNEHDLQWIGERDWEYQTRLHADAALLAREHVDLVFAGLDTYAEVLVNDTPVLHANDMFRRWRVPIERLLHVGDNSLRVRFHSPLAEGRAAYARLGYALPASNDLGEPKVSMFTRKAPYQYGWDWAPRLLTSGIWRPAALETWDGARLEDVHVRTESLNDERAELSIEATIEAARSAPAHLDFTLDGTTRLGSLDAPLSAGENHLRARVALQHPERWWPNGLGKQRLYRIATALSLSGVTKDRRELRIGLRTLEVVHERDEAGKSFSVRVNGVPVFMKGANYVPQDSFPSRLTPERYDRILRAAAAAHMNMLRVWGGGGYADDSFYDRCDELGLLVWQDFMFACSMYPSDAGFTDTLRAEATDNVRRLRNHPSLALWAGNNENEWAWHDWGWQKQLSEAQRSEVAAGNRLIFQEILPGVIAAEDPGRFYTRSTPSANDDALAPNQLGFGDAHDWAVWGGGEPYEKSASHVGRFTSEYGFQSLPELASIERFAAPGERHIGSAVMRAHQRHPRGDELIAQYLERDFTRPRDFASYLYVSQALQALIVQYQAEAHRRKMPVSAGSLYWQLDDAWPGASWSSIDYYGRWKALHYFARRFFAPVLASTVEEDGRLRVYGISDRREDTPARLELRLLDFEGRTLWDEERTIVLTGAASRVYFEAPPGDLLGPADRRRVVFVAEIVDAAGRQSRSLYYFEKTRNLALPVPELRLERLAGEADHVHFRLSARRLARIVQLSSSAARGASRRAPRDAADSKSGALGSFEDNYFDLLPGESIVLDYTGNPRDQLHARSIRDTY
jgi:beta-mannosidase